MAPIPLEQLKTAIDLAKSQVTWKPGKAEPHLVKRIRLGHLPSDASLADYESRIVGILDTPDANVYAYEFGEIIYPTVVSRVDQDLWLVMITMSGVLETAFPPDTPEEYLSNSSFTYIGRLGDL